MKKFHLNIAHGIQYNITGISEEEIRQLMTEFDSVDYKGDKGVCYPYNPYQGAEVINYLSEKYEAVLLEDYQKLFHPHCTESAPFKLKDGRYFFITPTSAHFFPDEVSYIKAQRISYPNGLPIKNYLAHKTSFMPNGERLNYQKIKSAYGEAFQKIYAQECQEAFELASCPKSTFYELSEGVIIEYKEGNSFVYKKATFEKLKEKWSLNQARIQAMKNHPDQHFADERMCGRNPYGEDFINQASALAESLPKLLSMPRRLITEDSDSLVHIPKYIAISVVTDEFIDEVFLPLLAFVGELIVKRGGEWTMIYDDTWKTWIPDVVYNGAFLNIHEPILEMLALKKMEGECVVLRDFVDGVLGQFTK